MVGCLGGVERGRQRCEKSVEDVVQEELAAGVVGAAGGRW
jgi:hypothetical protein